MSPISFGRRIAIVLSLAVSALLVVPAMASAACPCSLYGPFDAPVITSADDSAAVEVGMRFRVDEAGFVKGIRFYKGAGNGGEHVGTLWSNAGAVLARATFTGESPSGWQQVLFDAPVAVDANTTYVVSYHAPQGHYSATLGGFAATVDNAPLHGLGDGVDGANGVFGYSAVPAFPTSSYNSASYWVDVVWDSTAADTTPPVISSTTPSGGATSASKRDAVRAYFSEALDAGTVGAATAELRTAAGALVPSTVSYQPAGHAVVIDPVATLSASTEYVATVRGADAASSIEDAAGNALAASYSWSFTTAGIEPEDGPGGPILVVTDQDRPITTYTAEILRAEGLNEFETIDVDDLSAATITGHHTTIVGDLPLTAAQVTLLSTWATDGGNLVLLRPDAQLAGLAGLAPAGSALSNAYLKVDTSSAPGTGIVADTMQYHGAADRYSLDGATTVAALYSDATTATTNPAVALRSVGTAGGQVATFTYDLARSVMLTRQGNPAWAGTERDGGEGASVIRSDDLFFGNAASDAQADWVNLDKVAIPQADEQQRLLANVVNEMSRDGAPIPRFWYLPDSRKAVVVHALDDHNNGNATQDMFEKMKAASPEGCSVAAWTCLRATSWFYTGIPLTDAQAKAYHDEGFDLGSHINTGCSNFTSAASLDASFASELAAFHAAFPSLPAQRGNRTHCIPWSDWDSIPAVSLAHGIRIDMGYYYWPAAWVQNRPGFFTGSGMPQRYTAASGRMLDVYQLTNQLVNENGQSYPAATNALLDRALGPEGFYAVLGTHDDYSGGSGFTSGIIASAKERGVAVVGADQMLTWLDGRNASAMRNVTWSGGSLSFAVTRANGANGLTGMVPVESSAGTLQSLTRNGSAVTTTTRTVKGVEYAMYDATTGAYVASYRPYTVLGDATPANVEDSDTEAVELGMRFRSDVEGLVTGVRFYKGANNTGTHTGSLWTAGGTRLASVTFTGETASGWQQATFDEPVAIQPNVSYVVSYHAPNGRYSYTSNGFADAIHAAPLHAPADASGARNGVYAYGATSSFPTSTWDATNYWVDVMFRATAVEEPPTGEPDCPCTLFASTSTPSEASADDHDAVELGMRFTPSQSGSVTGVRFYKGAANTGTHVGRLWSASGALLAQVTFTGETASGWQQASFSNPVGVDAESEYVISYHAPNGGYAIDSQYFTQPVERGPLTAPASTGSAANGVYRYGAAGSVMPSQGWNASNYWVDAVFVPASGDSVAPTVTATVPAADATGVARGANVTATFSEALASATVSTDTFELRTSGGALVPATVAWNAATKVATLDPSSDLQAGANYTVTIKGGASGPRVTDAAGNALAADVTWSFTTRAPVTGASLFAPSATPATESVADADAVELGMRFTSDVAGTVTAVRFYKGAANTGTHVGHLWSASGTLLATVTFTGETASGWQTATLASPVAISANAVYVVSYHAPNGRYAFTSGAFASAIDAPPLHAPANGSGGGNGVFAYGPAGTFPTGSFNAANYWVDVLFSEA